MRTWWIIFSLFATIWNVWGCAEDRCQGDVDDGYCEGNIAHSCTLINDSKNYQWTQRTCTGQTPYCILGQDTVSESGPVDANCSIFPEKEPLCYKDPIPFCKGDKRLICGPAGSVTSLREHESCPQP